MDLLDTLRQASFKRTAEDYKIPLGSWSPTDWACALAGETGELCNLVKKIRRGDDIDLLDVADEAADVLIYLDLLCQRLGIDLGDAVVHKFNITSLEMNSKIKIQRT